MFSDIKQAFTGKSLSTTNAQDILDHLARAGTSGGINELTAEPQLSVLNLSKFFMAKTGTIHQLTKVQLNISIKFCQIIDILDILDML